MSAVVERASIGSLRHEIEALRGNWLLFALIGAAMILTGFVFLGSLAVTSLATAIAFGALLIVGGAFEIAGAFWSRAWSGFFFHLLSGVLSLVVGLMFLKAPGSGLIVLTLLVACYLMVVGLFTIVSALSHRFAAWGWPLLSGIVDLALGIMIWWDLPASALWVIGLFVGISMIFHGFNWVALAMALKARPASGAA